MDYEQIFVKKCIVKNRQDRLLYELGGKKRRDGAGRFCHDAKELLIPERIVLAGPVSESEIAHILGERAMSEECMIMAYNTDLDRCSCTASEALHMVLGNGMAAVVMAGSFAVVETEQCCGTPMRYVLKY